MASLITWLKYSGARKVDGSPVASGRAYFYQPGTVSTQVTVYSDKDGLVALAQPVALDAAGRAEVYTKDPCKVEVQQAVDFAQVAVSDRANTVNAKHVEIENANYVGTSLVDGTQVLGGRTNLDTVLTGLVGTGGGAGGSFKESTTATQRSMQDAVGDHVKLKDYGAAGDDATDDTAAIAAAVARAISSNKPLFIEPGTYRFNGPINLAGASAAGLKIIGANRSTCILKNTSGAANAITVDLSSAIESDIEMSDFTISNTGISTGKAIEFLNGNGPSLRRITVSGHRYGLDVAVISYANLEDCLVLSLDGNSASRGIRLGTRCIAQRCRVMAATNGRAFSFVGQHSRADVCWGAADGGTGFDMLASDCQCHGCGIIGGTPVYGFYVGAVSRSGCIGCTSTVATNDFTTDAAAVTPFDIGNVFTTRAQGEGGAHQWMAFRPKVVRKYIQSLSGASPSFTPDITKPAEIQVAVCSNAGAMTLTVNNTATTGLVDGQEMTIVVESTGGGSLNVGSWGSQYKNASLASLGASTSRVFRFLWRAATSTWVCLFDGATPLFSGGGPHWSS